MGELRSTLKIHVRVAQDDGTSWQHLMALDSMTGLLVQLYCNGHDKGTGYLRVECPLLSGTWVPRVMVNSVRPRQLPPAMYSVDRMISNTIERDPGLV